MSNDVVRSIVNGDGDVEELKQKLCDQLAEYHKAEWESLKLEKYKTGKLWDIGDVALPLKESLGHGNWEPFVEQLVKEGRVTSDRTMQRAMKYRKGFECREDCAGLTTTEADEIVKKAEKIAEEGDTACKRVTNSRKRKLAEDVRKLRAENERLLDELERRAQPQDDDEPQDQEDEDDREPSYPGYEEPQVDPDAQAVHELLEAVHQIVTEPRDLTPEQDAAFAKFVEALGGDSDQALAVAVIEAKLKMRKMYL
jgi:hypothetical protein